MRRVLATMFIALLAAGAGYKVIYGPNGTIVYKAKKAEYERLRQEIADEQRGQQQLDDGEGPAKRSQGHRESSPRAAWICAPGRNDFGAASSARRCSRHQPRTKPASHNPVVFLPK